MSDFGSPEWYRERSEWIARHTKRPIAEGCDPRTGEMLKTVKDA